MTTGKAFPLLVRFAVPLIIGNVFQNLYTMTDAVIIGRGVGTLALASVGAADWILWMVVGALQGFTQGFSIETAAAYGEGNAVRLKKAVGHALFLSLVLGTVFTVVSLVLMKPALLLLNTPADILPGTVTYLAVIYSACLIITFYNMNAALLRSFGDSRTPLLAMAAASLNNIVLDLLFVYRFRWGILGAASATVLSQLLACVICGIRVNRTVRLFEVRKYDLSLLKHLLKLGAPLAMQVIVIASGGIVLQSAVNGYGSVFVAGYTAANKLFGILESAGISFGYGVMTYTAQNLGAGKKERIGEGIRAGILFSVAVSVLIGTCMVLFGKNILSLFVDPEGEMYAGVLSVGYRYLFIMAVCLPLLYFLHLYKSALQGAELTVLSMNSGFIELGMRIFCIIVLPRFFDSTGIFLAEVSAWGGAALYLAFCWYTRGIKAETLTV